MSVLVLMLAACADAAPRLEKPDIVLEDVVATAPSGARVSAAEAVAVPGGPGSAVAVAATLPGPGPSPLEITAATSSWDLRGGQLTLEGNVVAIRGPARLTCDAAAVHFDKAGEVVRIEAHGSVILEQGDRTGRAETAVLDAGQGRVTLRGDATLAEPPHWMAGEPIVVFLDDERIQCESCRMRIDGASVGQGG